MTMMKGDYDAFLRVRSDVMRDMVQKLGGETSTGGPVYDIVQHAMRATDGNTDHRAYANFIVDVHDRALGCLVEIMEPPRLDLKAVLYDEPRSSYARHPNPLDKKLTQSDLN